MSTRLKSLLVVLVFAVAACGGPDEVSSAESDLRAPVAPVPGAAAALTLKAKLVGTFNAPFATGNATYTFSGTVMKLAGTVTNTRLPAGTVLCQYVNGLLQNCGAVTAPALGLPDVTTFVMKTVTIGPFSAGAVYDVRTIMPVSALPAGAIVARGTLR
jgi:hypothetical protein